MRARVRKSSLAARPGLLGSSAGKRDCEKDDALQAIEGSAWAIGLGEHSPDLGSKSASRPVAIASSSRARQCVVLLLCCVLDGEPTALELHSCCR